MADCKQALEKLDCLRKELSTKGSQVSAVADLHALLTHTDVTLPDMVLISVGGYEARVDREELGKLVGETLEREREALQALVDTICPPGGVEGKPDGSLPKFWQSVECSSDLRVRKPIQPESKWRAIYSPKDIEWPALADVIVRLNGGYAFSNSTGPNHHRDVVVFRRGDKG